MSNFTECPNCKASVLRGVDECPQCGHAMFARDRKNQARVSEQERRDRETLFCTDYERERFGLMPREQDETVAAYAERINRQKTPAILAEHKRLRDALPENTMNNLNLPRLPPERERIPGSDDDKENAREQAA